MSRPEPKYADPDARIRAQRLHSAWESWRLDSDADLALSESEDACRCDDALQAGEILERPGQLLVHRLGSHAPAPFLKRRSATTGRWSEALRAAGVSCSATARTSVLRV